MDYKELTNRLVCAGRIEKYYDEDSSGLYTRAATAITGLLARAEAAEARAEKAERERDEYFSRLKGLCFCCGHRKDGFDCHAKCYGHKRGSEWVYDGQAKEE